MANDPTNILVSGDAKVHVVLGAVADADQPADVDALLPVGAVEFGLTDDDGESFNRAVETTSISSHQAANVRTISTGGAITLELSALEYNAITAELYWASKAVGGKRTVNASASVTATVYYDTFDIQAGYEKKLRIYGLATITPNGPLAFTRSEATNVPLLCTFNGDIVVLDELD